MAANAHKKKKSVGSISGRIVSGQPSVNYATSFDSLDSGDIVFTSSDLVAFRMPSAILRTTSEELKDFLDPVDDTDAHPIELAERAAVLDPLFRLASGKDVSPCNWSDLKLVESVLEAAAKYGMQGPKSMIRILTGSQMIQKQPLLAYAIAAHHNWEEEAKLAATSTLKLHIHDTEYEELLQSIEPSYLQRLYKLHHMRTSNQFKAFIDEQVLIGGCSELKTCNGKKDSAKRRDFLYAMWEILKKRPLGDTLRGNSQLVERVEFKEYRSSDCEHRFEALMVALESHLASLPRTI